MSAPGLLQYHHDRADLRGLAWLVGIGGLAVLAIALPIVHKAVPGRAVPIIAVIAIIGWLAVWGLVWWRARAARGRQDTVAFDAKGFTSRLFGRVDFADIQSHAAGRDTRFWRWEVSAPSLRLTLADRRRLHFHLDARHYRQDLLDYVAFIETVLARVRGSWSIEAARGLFGRTELFGDVAAAATTNHATTVDSINVERHSRPETGTRRASSNAANPERDRPRRSRPRGAKSTNGDRAKERDERQGSAASRLSQANRQAGRRFRQQMVKNRKWLVLAGVLLPLSYSIRACDMSAIKPGPFDDMAERAPAALERSRSLLQTAIAEKGPVYLWSNTRDDAIKPLLAPNVQARNIGIDTLDMMNTAGSLTSFIIDGEAEGYRMGVQHNGTLTLSSYSKISLRPVDGEHTLFFFLLPPDGVDIESQTGQTMPDITWRVTYRNVDEIPEQIARANKSLPMSLVTRWMTMTPPPRLMVAAARYHGMTDTAFEAAVEQIKTDFERRGIDTSGFETRRFEAGTVRPPEAARAPTESATSNDRSTQGSARRNVTQ